MACKPTGAVVCGVGRIIYGQVELRQTIYQNTLTFLQFYLLQFGVRFGREYGREGPSNWHGRTLIKHAVKF